MRATRPVSLATSWGLMVQTSRGRRCAGVVLKLAVLAVTFATAMQGASSINRPAPSATDTVSTPIHLAAAVAPLAPSSPARLGQAAGGAPMAGPGAGPGPDGSDGNDAADNVGSKPANGGNNTNSGTSGPGPETTQKANPAPPPAKAPSNGGASQSSQEPKPATLPTPAQTGNSAQPSQAPRVPTTRAPAAASTSVPTAPHTLPQTQANAAQPSDAPNAPTRPLLATNSPQASDAPGMSPLRSPAPVAVGNPLVTGGTPQLGQDSDVQNLVPGLAGVATGNQLGENSGAADPNLVPSPPPQLTDPRGATQPKRSVKIGNQSYDVDDPNLKLPDGYIKSGNQIYNTNDGNYWSWSPNKNDGIWTPIGTAVGSVQESYKGNMPDSAVKQFAKDVGADFARAQKLDQLAKSSPLFAPQALAARVRANAGLQVLNVASLPQRAIDIKLSSYSEPAQKFYKGVGKVLNYNMGDFSRNTVNSSRHLSMAVDTVKASIPVPGFLADSPAASKVMGALKEVPKGIGVASVAVAAAQGLVDYSNGKDGRRVLAEGMGSVIGGAIGGVAGSFIPIPFVGTMVGNVVGGYVGGKIGDLIADMSGVPDGEVR